MKPFLIAPSNPDKRDRDALRDELERDTAAFEKRGGKVERLPGPADASPKSKPALRSHRWRPGGHQC